MSTWALLGLLVVVLVAVGIAAFLRWGRSRDEHPTSPDGAPPRTVADLVDRRARGLDDGDLRTGDDTADAATDVADATDTTDATAGHAADDAADDRAPEPVTDPADVPGEPTAAGRPGPPAAVEPLPAGAPEDAAAQPVEVERGGDAADQPDRQDATRSTIGPTHSSVPDITRAPDAADPADRVPEVRPDEPRVTPDVSAGPVGPPWSRGFKDGKPVEPAEAPPAPLRRAPRPSPVARPRPAAADEDAGTAGPGPDSSAPDISTPERGTPFARPRPEDEPDDDAEPEQATAVAGAGAGAATAAAAAASRADPRSPVDPDLVRRVTTVPAERPASRSAASPDTEREFREARDRITTQHGWTGRVPEQQGAPDTGRVTARTPDATARTPDADTYTEPPPRPAPRLLRSARPAPPPAPAPPAAPAPPPAPPPGTTPRRTPNRRLPPP